MTLAPTLETERLILRAPIAEDFEPLAEFFADEARSAGFGGPLSRHRAWRWFAGSIGHWHLRGFGFWTAVLKDDRRPCGIVGLWEPDGWPEPELGWLMFKNAEGKGLAYEAAQKVRNHAYAEMGFKTLISNITPGNTRSVALAEKMGASYERTFENLDMGPEMIYRHPAPEALL